LWPDGSPRAALRARLEATLAAAHGAPKAWVLVSGGAVNTEIAEGHAMARWLVDAGLDRDRLLVEGHARSTTDNADLGLAPLIARGVRRVTVISQPFHVQRVAFNLRVAARRAGWHLELDQREATLPAVHNRWRWALAESIKLLSDAACRIEPRLSRLLQRHVW
jgi:vancomycin permeability regulator SanA